MASVAASAPTVFGQSVCTLAPELSPARPASCPTHWLCPSPACYCANVGKQWYVIQVVHRLDGLKSNSDIYQPL